MATIVRRIHKLEEAWLATQADHVTQNDKDRAKGHYGQMAREFAPLLLEDLKVLQRKYDDLLEANERLIEERDRMIANNLQALQEIQRLKDVIARRRL